MAELVLANGAGIFKNNFILKDINWIVNKEKGYTLLMQLCAIKMELS